MLLDRLGSKAIHLYFFFYLVYLAMEWLRYQVSFHLLKNFIALKYCRNFKENIDCKFVDFARSNFIVFILTLEYVALSRSLQLSHQNAQYFCLFFQENMFNFSQNFLGRFEGIANFGLLNPCRFFQNERYFPKRGNEGCILMSKTRNGPKRGTFISVPKKKQF